MMVAEVVVDKTADKTFSYLVPAHLPAVVGTRVRVPFRTKERLGTVVAVQETIPTRDLRQLLAVVAEPPVSLDQLALARFLSTHYLNGLPQALDSLLPPPVTARDGHWQIRATAEELRAEAGRLARRAPRRAELLVRLAGGEAPAAEDRRLLRQLAADGWIHWQLGSAARPAPAVRDGNRLTDEQQRAVDRLDGAGESLLFGVTGSGKTEVYLEAIARRLAVGQGACLLLPEIALTPQLLARVKDRFGDRVAVWHSRLSQKERAESYWRVARGEVSLVVGARSAVFMPVERLGLVIFDESHETSFQQEESPRYHAQAVARFRLAETGGRLLLGSATPDVVDYQRASCGEIDLLTLSHRFASPLPTIEMVDLRRFGRTPLTPVLLDALRQTVAAGEQAILFLNRRGFHPLVLCRDCGFVLRCPHCQVAMVVHLPNRHALCHACGLSVLPPERCPNCQGDRLQALGLGTQRLEALVAEALPKARLVRLDQDTARLRGAYQEIHRSVLEHRADILIGTQMVAKGFDFPGVSLVGVVLADQSLHFPDYRSAERTFQLVTQAAGRSGRRQQGRVIVQAFDPSHYTLAAASRHDYLGFAKEELGYRQEAVYPPFTRLLLVSISAEDQAVAASAAETAAMSLRRWPELTVLGPSAALRAKVRDRYRMQVLVKHPDRASLEASGRQLQEMRWPAAVRLSIILDPVSLM